MGPWQSEMIFDFPDCPDDAAPPQTTTLACDPATGPTVFYASWNADASDFIANTCGPVIRYCQRGRSGNAPLPPSWPCPCDPTKYQCVRYMLDI